LMMADLQGLYYLRRVRSSTGHGGTIPLNCRFRPPRIATSHMGIAMSPSSNQEPSGSWDSIHVFEASERGRQAHYKLTSTIMLQLTTHQTSEEGGEDGKKATGSPASSGNRKHKDIQYDRKGEVTLSGSMTRQVCRFSLHRGLVRAIFVPMVLASVVAWTICLSI
jgi:hypothetical protein